MSRLNQVREITLIVIFSLLLIGGAAAVALTKGLVLFALVPVYIVYVVICFIKDSLE